MNDTAFLTRREKTFNYIWSIGHVIFFVGVAKQSYFEGLPVWGKICAAVVVVSGVIFVYKYIKESGRKRASTLLKETFPYIVVVYIFGAVAFSKHGMSLLALPYPLFIWLIFIYNRRFIPWLNE